MKRYIPFLFLVLLAAFIQAPLLGQGALKAETQFWLASYAGTWTLEETDYSMVAPAGELAFVIDPQEMEGDLARVYVSGYCGKGRPDYLLFRLEANALIYEGALWEGHVSDISRIAHIVLRPAGSGLEVELQETEHAVYLQRQLTHQPTALTGWACQRQDALLDLLAEGPYSLYDAEGHLTGLEQAFGLTAIEEDLAYLRLWLPGWPMYETACVQAEFEIVWLGSLEPAGSLKLYAIEWTPTEILLYQTDTTPESADGWFPLRRGPLAWIIVPGLFPPASF